MYPDLRAFINALRSKSDIIDIDIPISPYLEMTEISRRFLKQDGPAILFKHPVNSEIPAFTNLFASRRRVQQALGVESDEELRQIGEWLSQLQTPEPPKNFRHLWDTIRTYSKGFWMLPKKINRPRCQETVVTGEEVDLAQFPIQHCWPEDAAPLITWGLTITRGPRKKRQNLGVYRLQVIGKNKVIMRWLVHRGGALDYKDHIEKYPEQPFPVAIVIGADPATILSAVTPIPDGLSEYQFAGLLRKSRTRLAKCIGSELLVPESAEIVLEGVIHPNDTAIEGPFADHTGYYNEQDSFPVMTIERITTRKNPIYLSTYTGKPIDEPAVMGSALNEVFVPLLKKQFPEITDFYLPPEGCSYRLAVVSIRKEYPGHAKRVMFGIWSFLRQFMYTKFIIVTDDDVNIRDWNDVIWALTTRIDPIRDITLVDNTPIDYLDFASPVSGLGSKMGIDATNKWEGETEREWGRLVEMDKNVSQKIDTIWPAILANLPSAK